METASIQDASYLYNYVFIAIQVILLIVIISVGFTSSNAGRECLIMKHLPWTVCCQRQNIEDMLNHAKSANPMSCPISIWDG